MKRCGGDTLPPAKIKRSGGGNIRRPPLAVDPFMPRISTNQISILAVRTLRKIKRSGGDTVPLGGNIRRPPLTVGPFMPRISTNHISILAVRMLCKEKKRVIIKRSGGDTVPLGGNIRRAPLAVGPVMPRISIIQISILANRVVWWGYSGTREVIKGDGLCQGVQSCHEFQRVHISILVVHTPRKHDRSCLEMSEADGVDGGAFCKRGFIHLQFAEKPEAPEAERHLGSRILE
ncbi:hypothetical protein V1477_019675 [Vespula maculifrons]|uniref:Uncharacterized protein n=1 Tax=Vespula maculifrons TaxID=7453 RepID=A0ABD2AR47_VESMC